MMSTKTQEQYERIKSKIAANQPDQLANFERYSMEAYKVANDQVFQEYLDHFEDHLLDEIGNWKGNRINIKTPTNG